MVQIVSRDGSVGAETAPLTTLELEVSTVAVFKDTTDAPAAHAQTAATLMPAWEALRDQVDQGAPPDALLHQLYASGDAIAEAPALTAADVVAKLRVALHAAHVEHDVAPGEEAEEGAVLPWPWSVVAGATADLEALA